MKIKVYIFQIKIYLFQVEVGVLMCTLSQQKLIIIKDTYFFLSKFSYLFLSFDLIDDKNYTFAIRLT